MLRYTSIKKNKDIKSSTYSIFNFNTYGLRIPYKNSQQLSNQDIILNLVNQSNYTLACFQEFPMKGSRHGLFYEKLINGLVLPFKSLSEYSSEEKSTQLILVTASAFPILNEEVLYYNNRAFALITDIQFPERIIRVYNIHLQSVKFTQERKLLEFNDNNNSISIIKQITGAIKKLNIAFIHREEETDQLTTKIKNSPYPVIIAGDLNDTQASYTYNKIRTGLKDASSVAKRGIKSTYKYSTIPLNIDFIFHDKKILSSDYKQIKLTISDHYAIATRFKIIEEK